MNSLIHLANNYLINKNTQNRDSLLMAFDNVSKIEKINNPQLSNFIIRILSLPYTKDVVSQESEIASEYYSQNGKIFSQGQIEVLNYFLYTKGRKEVWVNAPTSWGKTLVASSIIFKKNYRKIAIIVPSIFLMNEIYEIFKKTEWDGDIRIFAEEEKANKFIHILTPERFNQSKQSYDFIVYDEFYKVSDNQSKIKNEFEINGRGFAFRKAFSIARKSDADLLLLSPWIKINAKSNWYEAYMKRVKLFDFVNPISFSNTFQNIYEYNDGLESFISENKSGISLIFADSYTQLKKVGEYLINFLPEINGFNQIEELFEEETTFHKTLLSKLIRRGVVVIGAALPRFLLIEVASYIKQNPNKIKYILSTSSISEGVNLPIDNIYIHKLSTKPTAFDLKNLFGRSGRFKDALNISGGNIFASNKILAYLNNENDFSFKPNIDDLPKNELSKKDRKKIERINRSLEKAKLLDSNKNLIIELSYANKEHVEMVLNKINHPFILNEFSKLSSITEWSNSKTIMENLYIYNNMFKYIFNKAYSEKEIKVFSSVAAQGIYASQMQKLKTMENTIFLNKLRFELGYKVSLLEIIYKKVVGNLKVSNSAFITSLASTKKRSVQNDFGLPKNIEKSKHPFVAKYVEIVDDMINEKNI